MPKYFDNDTEILRLFGKKGLTFFIENILKRNSYSKKIYTFTNPILDTTVQVRPSDTDTCIKFLSITENFSISLDGTYSSIGDRVYIMLPPTDGSKTIGVSGQINNVLCGDQNAQIMTADFNKVIELIYDGSYFTGIDNC